MNFKQRLGYFLQTGAWITRSEAKSITSGALFPVNQQGKAVWSKWTMQEALNSGYNASVWVYACINKIAEAAASVPWKVYRETKPGVWEEVPGHPLEALIEKPNPFMSRKDFIERMTIHLHLAGNAVNTKIKWRGVTAELWPMNPDQIRPVSDPRKFISKYVVKVKGKNDKEIDPADILHVMRIDPANPIWGLPTLQAAAKTIDTEVEASTWNKIALQNRAVTDGIFSFKQPLTRTQWEEAREMVREQHQGSSNARTPWVLGNEATFTPMSLSPVDMDFIEGKKMTREEICAVFQVPPPVVGILDKANYSTSEIARKIFWEDTIINYLDALRNAFNLSLTPEFGNDIYLDYDTSNVKALQESLDSKISNADKLWRMGVPFAQINQRLELGFDTDEIPGAEVGYITAGLLPANTDFAALTAPIDDEEDPADPGKSKGVPTPANVKSWGLMTEEQKTMYWKSLESRRASWYARMQEKEAKRFIAEGKAVVKAFKKGGKVAAVKTVKAQAKQWRTLKAALYTSIVKDMGDITFNDLMNQGKAAGRFSTKAEEPAPLNFDPFDALIKKWVISTAAKNVRLASATTIAGINSIIDKGMDEGASVDDMATAINAAYEGFSVNRAFTIARTETVGAANYGNYAAAKQTGLNPKKTWVSSRDERVRDDHKDADGQTVEIDEYFDVGSDNMLYPGDQDNGSARNVIKCRCAQRFSVL